MFAYTVYYSPLERKRIGSWTTKAREIRIVQENTIIKTMGAALFCSVYLITIKSPALWLRPHFLVTVTSYLNYIIFLLADDIKPCPRCAAYIIKMNDGSCNHMTCAVCGCEFCWLCMKEISDLHYLR